MKQRYLIWGSVLSTVGGAGIGQGLLTGDRSLLYAAVLGLLAGGVMIISGVVTFARLPRGLPLSVPPTIHHFVNRPALWEELVRRGLLDDAKLDQALARQRVTGEQLAKILLAMGFIKEGTLRALQQRPEDPWLEG